MEPQAIIAAHELANDCLNLHYDKWDSQGREESDLAERIEKEALYYELKSIPLSTLPEESDFDILGHKIDNYVLRPTPFPPIVLGQKGNIIDGNHRMLAARDREEETIMAYVPMKPAAARAHHNSLIPPHLRLTPK